MKLRSRLGLKGIVIPAIAALFLGLGITGCGSSSDGAAPDAAMTEDGAAANNSDPLANEANGNTDGASPASADGTKPPNNAAAGTELQGLVNDGSANAAGAAPAGDTALNNSAAGQDPFNASAANTPAPAVADPAAAGAVNSTGAPAAGGEVSAAPANSANPANPAADPFGPTASTPTPGAAPGEADGKAAGNSAPPAPETAATPSESAAPGAAPAASAGGSPGFVPENGSKMAYYIQKGDTLASISEKIYGKKGKWKSLQQENNLTDPNKIYAGDVVFYTVDNVSKGFAEKYEGISKQSVTVAKGDTLSTISAKVFGSQGSWRTLWKQNPQISNPNKIKEGMVLLYTSLKAVASKTMGALEVTADNTQE